MKKNVFFSAILALISVASYGQVIAKQGSVPTPVTCSDSPLNPIIGKKYTYTANANPAGGNLLFFATNNPSFINNGVLSTARYTDGNQLEVEGSTYNNSTNAATSVEIAWTGEAGTSYLVSYYKNPTTGATCANDNIKVWKIEPRNAFTIEVRNVSEPHDPTNSSTINEIDVCYGAVKSATYNQATNKVDYDYGEQKLYYEFIAANYDKNFKPKFKVEGLDPKQEVTLKWTVDGGALTNGTLVNIGTNNEFELPEIQADTNADPANGVSVYLELTIANKTFEGIADNKITLKADATTGARNLKDVDNTTCKERGDFTVEVSQILKKRPEITSGTETFLP